MEQQEIVQLIMGDMSIVEWQFNLILMGIGATMFILNDIKNRRDRTRKVSFRYYFGQFDNIVVLIQSILLAYILIRFYSNYSEHLISKIPEGFEVTPYFAMILLGYVQFKIIDYINSLKLR